MEHLTFTELCHKAGITETDANLHGLCRSEVEKLILNQSKN